MDLIVNMGIVMALEVQIVTYVVVTVDVLTMILVRVIEDIVAMSVE
jgi:hypothetical protein